MYHRMFLRRSSMSSISEESETGDDDEIIGQQDQLTNCLGDLNNFKDEIREAYQELSTLERQARLKTYTYNTHQDDDLDVLLVQLHQIEERLDEKKNNSSIISQQFDEIDQTLANLTNTLKNVEIECIDSGNSSSSSDSARIHDEHFSDSGLSRSTDSISLPLISQQISNASSMLSCDTLKNPCEDQQIRLALEKMHEANIKKLFVKIHNVDHSTKNILIDETMTIFQILILLFHKYHLKPTLTHSIIEDLPDLHIYRVFEDHQNLIHHGLIHWPRDTSNRICFREEYSKYYIFEKPYQFYFTQEKNSENILIDYISSENITLPDDITSLIYIKDKNRKIWKKSTCILRQSGIYQIPKTSSSKRDFICLIKFDSNMQLYYAKDWIEYLRSPTEYGFALKSAHIQKKSSKYIHYLCANTFDEYQRWINGIRIILHGVQLHKNYQQMSKILDENYENLQHLLPNQHHFNFINSTTSAMHHSISSISLPIHQIISDRTDSTLSLIDIDSSQMKYSSYSLDRMKSSKNSFPRSSSFHSYKTKKSTDKLFRTQSISSPDSSPIKSNGLLLKRSKSNKEISSSSSSSSIIPFINQCLQPDRTPVHFKPPKHPPPPIPPKSSPCISNHIYDSLQTTPIVLHKDFRTVTNTSLPPTRVTDL